MCKLIIFLVLLFQRNYATPGIFTAVAPKTLFPNSVFNISITLESGVDPTLFTATVTTNNKSYSAQELQISPGTSGILNLAIGDLIEETYNLTLKSETAGVKFEDTVAIFLDRKNVTLIIQSDKPIYKPGETIRFRVLVLNRFLKPFKEEQSVQVKISDPQGNVIKIWKDSKAENGLISLDLKLSDEPNLGEWIIEASKADEHKTHQVSVAQYVLPKFKVEVKLQNFITLNSSKIVAEVTAKYTYGKNLKGECTITLSPKNAFYYWYHESIDSPKHLVSKTLPINGTAIVEFESIKDNPLLLAPNSFYSGMEFEVIATIKDALTGREQNGSSLVKMYEHPYKIENIHQASSYQPGLPLKMTFKVSTQDDLPIEDQAPDALTITHGFAYNWEESVIKSAIPPGGIVSFTFIPPTNDLITVNNVEVTYKNLKQQFYLPQRMQSPSRTYLQLTQTAENVTIGEEIELTLKSTKEFTSLNYIICCKGLILSSGNIAMPEPTKEHVFKISVPPNSGPEAKIVVYSVFPPTNEIVAANMVKFSSGSILQNHLDITLSAETLEPGSNSTISAKTKADSLVALRGVDQSVLLLKEDKDITVATFDQEWSNMEQRRNDYSRVWGGSSTFQIFEEASLVILTNGALQKERYHFERYEFADESEGFAGGGGFERARPMMAAMKMASTTVVSASNSDSSSTFGGEVKVRTDFPETWLWQEFWVDEQNASFSFDKIVPDTITSWIVTGYSINSEDGVGVSLKPQILKTFRPFFISLNLPYSVVRDEVLSLQVLVHNYMEEEITATVVFDNAESKFQFANDTSASKTEKITVGSSQVSSVKFVIIPKEIGPIMLNLKALTKNAGDAISQALIVKPPGHKQTHNRAVLLDLRAKAGAEKQYNLTAAFPEKRVDGADGVKISVIADILGASISNLDKLLEMPCGCGEQNMVNFVPDIVILDYLTKLGILTPTISSKAIKFLESGYQRELTYRHPDGSFSAFGSSDPAGSTWLTAFVVRSFLAAKPYITIDEAVISQALEFLATKQEEKGCFREDGQVLHSGMQGGSSSKGLALTAYTLLAFLEFSKLHADTSLQNYSAQISKGLEYISKTEHFKKSKDKYAINLIAFTLDNANHSMKNKFFELMTKQATDSGEGTMYWEVKAIKEKVRTVYHPWETITQPVSVEMTSYALLTFIRKGKIEESLKIAKWLLKQRNAEGGFLSTQDTVVGLTALAQFAVLTRSKDTNLKIAAKHEGGTQVITINKDNAILLHEFILPITTRAITITATGKGTALAQLTWTYYVKDENSKPYFKISVAVTSELSRLQLKICTSVKSGKSSNMAVMEINVPSGYSILQDNLNAMQANLPLMKRYELEDGDTKLNIYFDSVTKNNTCISAEALKVFSVGNPAQAYVLVYDYYDTTRKARAFYDPPKAKSTACKSCGEDHENDEED